MVLTLVHEGMMCLMMLHPFELLFVAKQSRKELVVDFVRIEMTGIRKERMWLNDIMKMIKKVTLVPY